MEILLDECVTKRLIPFLKGHEVYTVSKMGWSGLKNGKLLSKCVEHEFEILLTIDKNLAFQQNLPKYPLSIVVFNSHTSNISDIKLFIPSFEKQLHSFEKSKVYVIEL